MRIALTKINKLYGIEPELKDASDEQRSLTARKRACRSDTAESLDGKTHSQVTSQSALGKAASYMTNNWSRLERYVEPWFFTD